MAKSFISSAKRVTDVKEFLRETASGNSIKYVAEKGAKHMIYIPAVLNVIKGEDQEEKEVKEVIALQGNVHEWKAPDGKYKSTICMKDLVRESDADKNIMLNDGSCPFCDRVSDGWDIYNYRKEQEEASCTLIGEDKTKHLETILSDYRDERKAKEARAYMYMLVVKFRYDGANPIIGSNGLPEFDLKVMKLSSSRVNKMQEQLANSGIDMAGSELIFAYPAVDDRRLQVSQSTISAVFPDRMLTKKYPGLQEAIDKEVDNFEWDGMEKAFPEWAGMTTAEAKKITDSAFKKWDEYKQAILVNPNAKYLEYVGAVNVTNPDLMGGGATTPTTVIPEGITGAPALPNIPDANSTFGGEGIQI